MASKSRLGKGLGALFPTLPGEEPVAEQPAMIEEDSSTPAATADITPAKKATAQQESKPAAPQMVSSSKAAKKAAGKRASMPALDTITHPSDLFFGTEKPQTGKVAAPQQGGKSSASQTAHRTSVTVKDVSRETSLTASAAKTADSDKKDELKPVAGGYLAELKLSDIGPNAHQPRTIFDEDELNELSASIKEVGVLQPIVVRKRPASQIAAAKAAKHDETESSTNPFAGHLDSPYELIMGERRWRASQLAGLETIPAIVKTTADDDMLRDALLENLHRVALNPLEEAAAYQQMIEEFGLTQVQLSKSVSKSRPQIANTLRLLNLPASVQKRVAAGVLSSGHARALLGLSDPEEMDKLASRIIAEGLSVRSTEEIVAMKMRRGSSRRSPRRPRPILGLVPPSSRVWKIISTPRCRLRAAPSMVASKSSSRHQRIWIASCSCWCRAKAMPIPNGCNTIRTFVLSPALLLCSALYAQDVIASA